MRENSLWAAGGAVIGTLARSPHAPPHAPYPCLRPNRGLYTFAAARLGLQAESIASLKGAAVEHKYLLDLWALHKHDIWEHNLNILKVRCHPTSQ
jgi:hypothetical protein